MTRATLLVAAVAAGLLAGIVPAAQAELRVGENYRLASDPAQFRGKDAVALAVNPNDSQHIVEVNANHLLGECEATVSRDGGSTWSTAAVLRPPAPGVGEPFVPTCRASDHLADFTFQTVVFGSGQNVYAVFSTPRSTASGGEQGSSVLVAKSVDGGTTFAPAVVAMAGGGSGNTITGGPYYELPSVAVDPAAGQNGADRVIVAAREVTNFGDGGCAGPPPPAPVPPECSASRGDAMTAVSNDGALNFSEPVQVEPSGENVAGPDSTSPPVVLPDHSIAIAWRTSGNTGPIKVARGTVEGQTLTWGAPVTAAVATNTGANTSNPPEPNPSNGSSFPRMAVDRVSGTLYLVYNQGPAAPGAPEGGFQGADHFISPDSDVYFQRSLNQGGTWSTPKLINQADEKPGHESPASPAEFGVVTQTRHPDVSVAPNGRVDVVWEDRRHWYRGCIHTHVRCAEARLGDTYYAFSEDKGSTFSPNKRISDQSHNNDVGYDYRFGTGWAFGPVAVPLGNSQLLVGWMDAREGNFDSDTQDIYLAKVDHGGPADVPRESIARTGPVETSVRLSREAYPGGGESLLDSVFATRNGARVVIVNENDEPAILAAGVLARANLSQVLLSPPGGLPASVKAEVARMGPAGAYVIGDSGSLSNQVVQDLQDAGVPSGAGQIERLGGGSNAATARAIAEELDRRSQAERDADISAFNAVTIVNPGSPDASAVSALSAARRLPILFASDSVPSDTTAALSALDVDAALIVGRPALVSDAAVDQLPDSVATKRLGGADQYATSRAVVAESLERGLPDNIAYVADGARPRDGALLGSAVGRMTGLLMLSPAPLSSSAAGTADANGLKGRLDRLVLLQPAAAGPPGGPGGSPPAMADTTSPRMSRLGIVPRRFAVAPRRRSGRRREAARGNAGRSAGTQRRRPTAKRRRGRVAKRTTFRFRLSERSRVVFSIQRKRAGRRVGRRCVAPRRSNRGKRRCVRFQKVGRFARQGSVGANRRVFRGRIGRRTLRPGVYRVRAVATDRAGNRSRVRGAGFRIVKRR